MLHIKNLLNFPFAGKMGHVAWQPLLHSRLSLVSPTHSQRSCWGVYWFHSVRHASRVSFQLVALQFWLNPFDIYTCYQTTSEGLSCVKFLAKFKNLNFWQFFKIFNFDFCLVLAWDLMWITSMDNHGAAGGISEPKHSSCSSYYYFGVSITPPPSLCNTQGRGQGDGNTKIMINKVASDCIAGATILVPCVKSATHLKIEYP